MYRWFLETYDSEWSAHKCYSKHAPIESVMTKKIKKIKHYLRQEKSKQKQGIIILVAMHVITYA